MAAGDPRQFVVTLGYAGPTIPLEVPRDRSGRPLEEALAAPQRDGPSRLAPASALGQFTAGPPVRRGVRRQPPWGLPSGRRPLGPGAPLVPGVLHLPLCIYGFPVVASEWLVPSDGVGVPLWLRLWATVVVGAWVTWTAAGGITVLATAFTRHRASLASGSWWGANSASAAWYGTALLGAVASGVALAYGMLQGHPSANPDLALLNVAIPAAMLGSLLPALSCVLVAGATPTAR